MSHQFKFQKKPLRRRKRESLSPQFMQNGFEIVRKVM